MSTGRNGSKTDAPSSGDLISCQNNACKCSPVQNENKDSLVDGIVKQVPWLAALPRHKLVRLGAWVHAAAVSQLEVPALM